MYMSILLFSRDTCVILRMVDTYVKQYCIQIPFDKPCHLI